MTQIVRPSFNMFLWLIRIGPYLFFPLTAALFYAIENTVGIPFSRHTLLRCCHWGSVFAIGGILAFIAAGYRNMMFKIDHERLSYDLSFVWRKRKEILLSNIKEVVLKVGVLQRFFGRGTIIVYTQASLVSQNQTGVSLFDIENPDKIYELLKERIASASRT